MKLLLFSNSTNSGDDYLEFPLPYIKDFLGGKTTKALFIPYAGIRISWDEYFETVETRLLRIGIRLHSIHKAIKPEKALEKTELIIVGGGNTFNLLKTIQEQGLDKIIREKVRAGVPYIGWSAGSNLCCPTIRTTNDMPVVEPQSFNALNLIPFQINPHYTDAIMENHAGETREMRIEEFLIANPDIFVVGLREGTLLHVENKSVRLYGAKNCRIFRNGQAPKELSPGSNFSFLMQ